MTDNTTNMQALIYITLHRKLKIEQYEPHKMEGNTGDQDELASAVLLV